MCSVGMGGHWIEEEKGMYVCMYGWMVVDYEI